LLNGGGKVEAPQDPPLQVGIVNDDNC